MWCVILNRCILVCGGVEFICRLMCYERLDLNCWKLHTIFSTAFAWKKTSVMGYKFQCRLSFNNATSRLCCQYVNDLDYVLRPDIRNSAARSGIFSITDVNSTVHEIPNYSIRRLRNDYMASSILFYIILHYPFSFISIFHNSGKHNALNISTIQFDKIVPGCALPYAHHVA